MATERHHKDYDIDERDMDPETKELNDIYNEEDILEEGEDVIDDDFIRQLNAGEAPLVLGEDESAEEMKEEWDDPFADLKGFMPSGLSSEMQ